MPNLRAWIIRYTLLCAITAVVPLAASAQTGANAVDGDSQAAAAGETVQAVVPQASSQDELHATIMAALLADPRTAQLPPEKLQALVDSLAQKAKAQGVTAADISWQPVKVPPIAPGSMQSNDVSSAITADDCQPGSLDFCVFSQAFGLSGNDYSIPVALFITAGLLFIIIRRLLHHHKQELAAAQPPLPPTPGAML